MKKTLLATMIISATTLAGCGGGGGGSDSNNSNDNSNDGGASAVLTVTASDYFTGTSLSGTEILVTETVDGSTNTYSGTTDENGELTLTVSSDADRIVVSGDAADYGEYSRIITDGSLSVQLFMQPINSSVTFSPSSSSDLTVSDLNVVSLAANSIVDADGNAPAGDVTAEITIIDPSVDPELMPGNYEALDENGDAQPIESFGAVSVTFNDDEGNSYNLGTNQTATIRIPLGSNSSDIPTTIPLYYYDEETGYWVEEGTATLVIDTDGSYYEGTVSHFTTWNADFLYETIAISGCVEDSSGEKISSASIQTQGVSYSGQAFATTDLSGNFSVLAKPSSSILLTATSPEGTSRTYTLATGTSDETQSECITLETTETSSATVTLTWGENPSDLDTQFIGPTSESGDGKFLLFYGNDEVTINNSYMYLDVDDVTSYGPEITTISSFPYAGRYSYAVYRYAGSSTIAASPARVKVTLDNATQVFSPPSGDATDCWAVFDFVVDSNGGVTVETVGSWEDDSYCYPDVEYSYEYSSQRSDVTINKSNILKDMIKQKYYAK
ncbi:hypothetical protein [Vibrio ziniensis]|uniref:Carboxypeptidase regulatory-like domain-containing protein n=1 Tax=Vibrio ziniensis TaxID=2711221 RepID=A0A6G7CLE0_9VIBR|nr:hypothetical protein [Vibrio ziniensis]QIH42951.1 hypothetical protein G5S32_13780 [Vibrio ziniensis]